VAIYPAVAGRGISSTTIVYNHREVPDAVIEPGQQPGRLIGDYGVLKIGAGESSDGLQ